MKKMHKTKYENLVVLMPDFGTENDAQRRPINVAGLKENSKRETKNDFGKIPKANFSFLQKDAPCIGPPFHKSAPTVK